MADSRASSPTRVIVEFDSIRPKLVAIRLFLAFVLALAAFVPAGLAQTRQRSYFESKLAVGHKLPFSSGVLVGDTLYIAGTTAVSPEKLKTAIGAEDEARLVMDNVRQVLQQAGMTMDDLVSVQVFCTDLQNYDAFNRVYKTYFHGKYPARAFVGVSNLLFGARFEVMGIAIRSRR